MLSSKILFVGCCSLFSVGVICPLCGLGTATSAASPAQRVATVAAAATVNSDTLRVELAIEGMTCGSCATTARIVLERTDGVIDADVSYEAAAASVLYDETRISPQAIIDRLEEMTGYEAAVQGQSNVVAPFEGGGSDG